MTKNNKSKEAQQEKRRAAAILHSFYKATIKDAKIDILVDRLEILTILKKQGFFRYDINPQTGAAIYIQITNKIVKEVSITAIRDFWFKYLENLPIYDYPTTRTNDDGEPIEIKITPEILINKFLGSIGNYFSEQIIDRLTPDQDINFIQDKKDCKYLFYKNGYVTITAADIHFNPNYENLEGYIWEEQILQRNFNPHAENYHNCFFAQFLFNISGKKQQRLTALQTIIGYLLHTYKDYKLKAPILTDAFLGSDGEANGRTGKGLFSLGLKYMLNDFAADYSTSYVNINGKNFKLDDKHRYEDCFFGTSLVHLEDIKAYTNIEDFFNDITEGVMVNKKNEKPFRIHPKIIFSTNKTLKIEGDSAKDRVIMFEFSDHYSSKFNPQDEFNHWFFKEWETSEWQRFDLFMAKSIQQFFVHETIIEAETINLQRRTLLEHTSREFVIFIDFYKFNDQDHKEEKPKGFYLLNGNQTNELDKKELYTQFLEAYPEYGKQKNFSQNKFTKWLKLYSQSSDLIAPLNEYSERRSNGKDFITFKSK